MLKRFMLPLLVGALALTGCADALVTDTAGSDDGLDKRDRAAGQQTMTVVETALAENAETGEFSTLIAALIAADLVGAVDAYDQVTVFAPNDAAFASIGLNAGNVGDLDVEVLTEILLYHLKEGRQFSTPVLNKKQIAMENGGFTFPDASVPALIDQSGSVAPFVEVDIPASNGVIHVIGAVLDPIAEE